MDKKIIILILIMVFCTFFVSSDTYNVGKSKFFAGSHTYNAGEIINIYNISQCDGPVKIKLDIQKNISKDDIVFERCVLDNGIWICQCQNSFDVVFKTKPTFSDSFLLKVQYYSNYTETNEKTINNTDKSFVLNEVNKRSKRFRNITIKPVKEKISFNLTKEQKKTIFYVLGFLLVGILLFFSVLFYKIFRGEEDNEDIFNYRVE